MKYDTTGYVIGGRLKVEDRQAFETAFASWPDGPAWITIESAPGFRSPQQNRYWHAAIVKPFADHAQCAPREMHDALTVLLLPVVIVIPRAGYPPFQVTIGGQTSKLTRTETANLFDRAHDLAGRIPLDLNRGATTHFIPYDHPDLGAGDCRALCGALTNRRQHAADPTCPECAATLAEGKP